MAKPWDIPPLPQYGDVSEDETYKGVGRIMSAWETIEFQLCVIHAVFCGDPRGEAMRLYGEKRVFPGRLDDFGRAAKDYFIRAPDQAREGALNKLLVEVRAYIDRRNDVAHGVVLDITKITFFRKYLKNKDSKVPQFAVLAPYHSAHRHASDGLPRYAYTSSSLATLEKRMGHLFVRLQDYEYALPGHKPPQEQP